MSSSHNTYINLNGFCATDLFKLTFLKNSKQFSLDGHRHLSDFIKENCSAISKFKTALAVRDRPGERPLNMAKKFTLNQTFR